MNIKGMALGCLIGTLFAVGLTVGFQYSIWGYYAPDWYAGPVILVCIVLGFGGCTLGQKYFK